MGIILLIIIFLTSCSCTHSLVNLWMPSLWICCLPKLSRNDLSTFHPSGLFFPAGNLACLLIPPSERQYLPDLPFGNALLEVGPSYSKKKSELKNHYLLP